jgi:hypothetical protein
VGAQAFQDLELASVCLVRTTIDPAIVTGIVKIHL